MASLPITKRFGDVAVLIDDQIVGYVERVSITHGEGADLEKLATLVDVRFSKCPTCYAPLWRRILFFPYYWLHRRKCEHEKAWRKILRGQITGMSIGGHCRRFDFDDPLERDK